MKSADELVSDKYGRKVLLYLLMPRDPVYFHPDVVAALRRGDSNKNR
jgi:pumilio family protein 6